MKGSEFWPRFSKTKNWKALNRNFCGCMRMNQAKERREKKTTNEEDKNNNQVLPKSKETESFARGR